ncbi:MAG TPA: DedA family protein [Ktedonobacterales bacterium]|nr:DedA family protein [Ktedonobacterales bacterium]
MDIILELVATYGYIVVMLVIMAESAGAPLPGETTLLIGGAMAGAGHLWLPGVIIAAAAGAILGDTAGYWVGRRYGIPLLRKHGRLFRFDESKLLQAEAFFARHGDKTVFLGRFVPIGRIFSAVLAGVSQMHYRRFLIWNATGGIVWASLMGTLGYLFGRQLPLIESILEKFGFGVLGLIVLAVVVRMLVVRRAAWIPALRALAQRTAMRVDDFRRQVARPLTPPLALSPRTYAIGGAALVIGGLGALALLLM